MPKPSTAHIIGIDLGTTYSCVGIWMHGKVEIVPNEAGNRTTPSIVAFTQDARLVGDAAKNQAILSPELSIYDAKRMIGKKFDDETISKDRISWPFTTIQGPKNNILIEVKLGDEKKQFSPEQISSFVLIRMKEIAEQFLLNDVKDAVITVPAYFNDAQRLGTKDAGALASLNVERIVNEPTAACIAYGMDRSKKHKERSVLIFDLGGGTFDVSILCIEEGIFEVKATNGNTHLGGEDFDRCMTEYYLGVFHELHPGTNIKEDQRAYRRLKNALERAKRTISSRPSTRVELDAIHNNIDWSFTLTRARFEEQCKNLFEMLIEPIKTCVQDAGYEKKKIHDIVLVGGSTRIPRVKQLLIEEFPGRHLSESINPDEAVAYGAAVQGAILSGLEDDTVNHLLLLDVIPLSLGVETEGKYNEIVIPKNSTIPTTRDEVFSAATDFQTFIKVRVHEGERPRVKDCHFLGEFEIQVKPVRQKESKIRVNFDVDADGLLEVTAIDVQSKNKNKLTITSERRLLASDDVRKMIEEAEKHVDEDNHFKSVNTEKNELRTELKRVSSYFDDEANFKKIKPEQRALDFKKWLNDFNIWVDADTCEDINIIRQKMNLLKTKFNEMTTKLEDPNYDNQNSLDNNELS